MEDNDTAQDFKIWCERLTGYGVELYDAIEKCLSNKWFKDDADAILMAGKLEYELYGNIKHDKEVIKALKEELASERLDDWTNPDERKSELLKFAKCVGML